jgi:hypothetical protein
MEKLTAVIRPDLCRTRLLVSYGREEVLKALLAPATQVHRRAAPTLLEGLALWFQQPLGVVLAVDELHDGAALGLCDDFGFGARTVHYHVDVRQRAARRGLVGLGGIGDFRALRRQLRRVGP